MKEVVICSAARAGGSRLAGSAAASALRFDERRLPPLPSPRIGQHTREVLEELLALPGDVIAGLERRGVIGASG